MNATGDPPSFYIGWDVGGWNCDKNAKSRDAIIILDSVLSIVGQPWRGNLRGPIVTARTASEWLSALFTLCKADYPAGSSPVTIAIDTPLGFSEEFVNLVNGLCPVESIGHSSTNPYLFRRTERRLFERGLSPLSAVKDMIGSQATKGMHVLARFAPILESCGVWTNGAELRAIETYPAACRKVPTLDHLLQGSESIGHQDIEDARICALIAYLFATDRNAFEGPDPTVPHNEGWIWIPGLMGK